MNATETKYASVKLGDGEYFLGFGEWQGKKIVKTKAMASGKPAFGFKNNVDENVELAEVRKQLDDMGEKYELVVWRS